jgi:16S rRNA (cytosine967-C5)-methyltransferase
MIEPQPAASVTPLAAPLAEALFNAAALVAGVFTGRTLDASLAAARLSGAIRAATMDLAYATLRRYGRDDFFLQRLVARSLAEPQVRALLLVTLARLENRPEDAHTTVDQAVTAAARIANGKFKGLVNGVLRNFLRRRDELLTLAAADPVASGQHPDWWIKRLRQDHPQHWREILSAGNVHPPMALRINRRRLASADFFQRLAAAGIAARHADAAGLALLDDAAALLDKPLPVARIPGFAEGLCSVQDLGAQLAARLLDVRDGQRVLDACAAPGGKATHLLELANIDLLALDSDPARCARIDENLARLGLAAASSACRATVKTGDAAAPAAWWDGRLFDRILADVPCTASGVVRRHPDAKWLRQPADIGRFATTQRQILDALWPLLAPGGKLLYATCSVFAAENGEQAAAFLERHADARRLSVAGAPQCQLLPTAAHDGFFYALLQKI